MDKKKFFKFIGLVFGVVFLSYSCWQVQWSEFLNYITNIESKWVALMVLSLAISMFLRSMRWQILIGLPLKDAKKVWEASCIGYLGIAIYPARIGDLFKMMRLRKLTGISAGEAFTSLVIDRMLDGFSLGILLMLFFVLSGKEFNLSPQIWLITAFFMITLFLLIYGFKNKFFENLLFRITKKYPKTERINLIYTQACELKVLKQPIYLFFCLIIQLAITSFDILACLLLFYAFGWINLTLVTAIVMLIYLTAAFILPSSPGYVGVYQIASVLALSMFGVDKSGAVAYGTIFQIITFILFLGFGLAAQFGRKKHSALS